MEKLIIPSTLHNQRVDAVLAKLFNQYSRAQWTRWIKQALVTVNHHTVKPKDKVYAGDVIEMTIPALESVNPHAEPENIPLTIVYEDEYLLIVNKPAGLVVHPGAGNARHTLVNALLYYSPPLAHLPRAGIIHRLDKETTGLLLIGKQLEAHTQLVKQMQARAIHREYLTLVHGHLISSGEIATFYGRHPHNRLKMAVCQQGRQATTHYAIEKHYGNALTLLKVTLLTGRTHQIRVHMAHIRHPVVGDPLYGQSRIPKALSESTRQTLLQFKRQALHAASLSLMHPVYQKELTVTASLPDDFQLLLDTLDEEFH